MTAPAVQPKVELPVTIQWYREGASWMSGLAGAAIGAGMAFKEEILIAGAGPLMLFALGLVLFVIALFAGIRCYFWMTTYGNRRELAETRKLEAQSARDAGDAAEADRLAKEESFARERMTVALARGGNLYRLMLWTFSFGAAAYAAATAWFLLRPPAPEESWSIVTVPCTTPRCRLLQLDVLRIEQKTGRTWYLTGDSTHVGVWKLIAADTTSAVSDSGRR